MKFKVGDWVKITPEPYSIGRVAECDDQNDRYYLEVGNRRDWYGGYFCAKNLVEPTDQELREHGGDRVRGNDQ